jgi:sugar/nucleoside kinase (ribokinase family)
MALREEGIGALMSVSDEGDSGFCVVLVEPDGERTFITSPGVEAQPGAIADVALDMADALFVSGYDLCYPELGAAIAARIAMLRVGVYLAVDPGPLVADIPSSIMATVLARVDMFTLNQREAGLLASTLGQAAVGGNILSRLRPAALMIIRNGSAGCVLFGAGFGQVGMHVPAPQVHMIDSTGAGDAHTGVFLASLASGLDPVQAARRANAAAAFAVTRRGPATAPRTEELDAFLAA